MFEKISKISAAVAGKVIASRQYNNEIDNIYSKLSTLDANTLYYDSILQEDNFITSSDMYYSFGLTRGKDYYIRSLQNLKTNDM